MNDLPGTDEPIVALATPLAESALAVIRATGAGCIELVAGTFSGAGRLAALPGHSLITGEIYGDDQSAIDQVVAAVFRSPKSYTGQDVVELFCHGSPAGIAKILSRLRSVGFRDAGPGEFTLRAFLNGKLGLTEAEAVNEIIKAKSGRAQSLALDRLSGAVEKPISGVKKELLRLAAATELSLDYPEDELEISESEILNLVSAARSRLAEVAATYRTGKILQDGATVALVGPTNVGKSSLFNLFLKEDRSIVSEIHGTTRDYIESWIQIDGIPLKLLDTAGMRNSDNPIETEGIRRTEQIVRAANVVIYLADASSEGGGADTQGHERWIRVWHKADIAVSAPPPGYLPVSSVTGEGFSTLEDAIRERVAGEILLGTDGLNEVIIDSVRQKDLLNRAVSALDHVLEGIENDVPLDAVSMDIKDALDALGEISGEITSADILNQIFSDFCVGK